MEEATLGQLLWVILTMMATKDTEEFSTNTAYSTGFQSNPYTVSVGDMNHDNRLDIVVVNYGTDNLLVFFGKGDGTFSQSNSYPTGPNSTPFGVLIADFNDDNYLDIATANTCE
ncbi:unnamed protein product, partial [Rotaria magnacalcarata]